MESSPTILRLTPDLYKAMDADRREKLSKAMQSGSIKVEVAVPEGVATETATPTPEPTTEAPAVPSGAAIAEAFAAGRAQNKEKQNQGWWGKAKDTASDIWEGVKRAGEEILEPVAQGAQNVVDLLSPVDIEVSDHPSVGKALQEKLDSAVDKDSTPYKVYERLGELSRTDRGFHNITGGKANPEDIESYKKNRDHLLIDLMGYVDVGEDKDGKTWIQDKSGKWLKLDEEGVKQIVAEAVGDKGEILGAMAGATAGVKAGKALGTKGKLIGGVVGGALGAMGGNAVDQLESYLRNGEELSWSQRMGEANKAAAMDIAGAAAGGALLKGAGMTLKLAGKSVALPAEVTKKVYKHILNGNIDGATAVLKRDLGIDDAYMDEALSQMQALQKEQYGAEENLVAKAWDGIKAKPTPTGIKEAVKGLGYNALDTLGSATEKERLLATAMQHEQGAGILAQGLKNNPKGALELERSIDARAKQITAKHGMNGTEVKRAVSAYEDGVKQHFEEMRQLWSDAFAETGYRFDLDSLGLGKQIEELGKRVTDPHVRDRFVSMADAVEEIVGKGGDGITRDMDDLLDIRQLLNRFYDKNKNALSMRPDKESFKKMIRSVDAEIERATKEHLPEDLGKRLLGDFEDAKRSYSEMYALEENPLYRAVMADGKGAEERMAALLKHADDDGGELKQLLEKLPEDQAQRVERGIIDAVVEKHTLGKKQGMQAVDYDATLESLKRLEPFLTDRYAKEKIGLLEKLHQSYKHDFELAKYIKGVSESAPSGGIAMSVEGRMRASFVDTIFKILTRLKPRGENPKRLALYAHLGSAMKKSRTPVELAQKMVRIKQLPYAERRILKEMVRDARAAKSAENAEAAAQRARESEAKQAAYEAKQQAREEAIASFSVPSAEEIRAVESLAGDDAQATFAQALVRIADGKGSPRDIERYLDAKEKIGAARIDARVEKWQRAKGKAQGGSTTSEAVPLERADPNLLFAKGLDHLAVGGAAGITMDEAGEIHFDPARFVAGMGGYAALKAAIKHPGVQREVKAIAEYALEQVEKKFEGTVLDTRSHMFGGEMDARTVKTSDLIVQHNLTLENIEHADKMGGLAVPSIAITKVDMPISGYGEVTLLGDKHLIKPSKNTVVHGADVYSPRYPETEFRTTTKQLSQIAKEVAPYEKMTGSEVPYDVRTIEDLTESTPFVAKFLSERDIKPKIVKIKPDAEDAKAARKYYKRYLRDGINPNTAYDDKEFVEAVKKKLNDEGRDLDDNYAEMIVRDEARRVYKAKRDIARRGEVDPRATTAAIKNQIAGKKLADVLRSYAREYLEGVGAREMIFDGFSPSGNRRYSEHTLENVVKRLKKDLIGGENFNYGLGPVRAHWTPKFRTLDEIRANKKRLVSKDQFEVVKKEANDAFFALEEELAKYSQNGDSYRFSETVTEILIDSQRYGASRALKEHGIESVPEETVKKIESLGSLLRDMPTEYFEANLVRKVDLGNFRAAIVPKGTPKKTTDILRDQGLKIKRYDPNIKGSREQVIKETASRDNLLFSAGAASLAMGDRAKEVMDNRIERTKENR